jgi:hemerythrin-like metal-binding protein
MTPERFVHYKSGIEWLDDEHWALLSTLNDAMASTVMGTREETLEILKRFLLDLVKHAKNEEEFMQAHNYQYVNAHKLEHGNLLRDIEKILIMFNTKELYGVIIKNAIENLRNRIIYHIDYSDSQYFELLKKQTKIDRLS